MFQLNFNFSISSSVGKDHGFLDTVLASASGSCLSVQVLNHHFQMDQGSSAVFIPGPMAFSPLKDHGILSSSGFSPGGFSTGLHPETMIPDPMTFSSLTDHGILSSSGFSPGGFSTGLHPQIISSGLLPISSGDFFPGLRFQHTDVQRRFRSQQRSLQIARFQKKVRLKFFWELIWNQFFAVTRL